MKKNLSKIYALSVLFLTATVLTVHAQKSKPNILVIFSDDHAQQTISAYGSKMMKTPNIDRIAKEGVILQNTFVTNLLRQNVCRELPQFQQS